MGVAGLHFHDLRHTGDTLAADMGVSPRNLTARTAHDDERAALMARRPELSRDEIKAQVGGPCPWSIARRKGVHLDGRNTGRGLGLPRSETPFIDEMTDMHTVEKRSPAQRGDLDIPSVRVYASALCP
jgi:hypothetical protein